eukprot:TRINITY_DN6813_c0_g2_i1.p2 TRINITY_DN6813_c0_g2~~TRINITY_DN6813_c0_g2_i1.p2  ORF type:complete len:124 (-),score=22.36 TRINITY_DN6813_c0_g2_i1:774-1145(-)
MIRRIIALALLLAMLSPILAKLFVYAEFKSNQAYIAATLCENRDRPELNCEGKCYLMKKLKAAEDKEKKQENQAQKKASVDLFFVEETVAPVLVMTIPAQKKASAQKFSLPEFDREIAHPPSC